ncbi:hypothetical protein BH23GEM8_BH23GEM8_16860 [soil metagenome]
MPAGDVYRFGMPRSDRNVTSQGVRIMTSLALGSWVAMKQSGSGPVIATGDLVLNRVIARLEEVRVGQGRSADSGRKR